MFQTERNHPEKIPLYLRVNVWQQDVHAQICRSATVLLVYLAPWPSPLKVRSHLRLATAARLTSNVLQATTDAYVAGDLRVAFRNLSKSPLLIPSSPPQLGFTFCCFLIFVVPRLQVRHCCHIKKRLIMLAWVLCNRK
ncbi:hypothetical protein IscW_ISCW021814 [Ixodes scapularis]|uniref:Uncharacterized protein n=1 Tax=Ixodes scapularis TaxID=6945 RepID=B7Q8S4_IXOSC|nr:hypothetical protein IscW_ISCW021814 [Ixodes scapularis]|eukprot:XP_002412423.1 hypothetical protein IscW_ISCW021814 [Ixodes scapularis]